MPNELKQCPFCGSKPTIGVKARNDYGVTGICVVIIKCKECGTEKSYSYDAPWGYQNAYEKVIKEWNRRAE